MNNLSKINNKKNIFKKGFSIIETIIYFSLLIIVSAVIINSIISLFKNYNIVRASQDIEYNAINIFDKITHDIRDAKSINVNDSYFSIPQGSISLNVASTTNDNASNTIKFYLNDNKLKYMINGLDIGNLSTNSVNVSNFKIFYINSSSSEAIKVELTLNSIVHLNSEPISKNFYTTIQLRN